MSKIKQNPDRIGLCFEFAARIGAMELRDELPASASDVRVVHGHCKLQCAPYIDFVHGWVEYTSDHQGFHMDYVYDPVTQIEVMKPIYYKAGEVQSVMTYKPAEVHAEMLRTEIWGPWDDGLLAIGEEALTHKT